MSTSDPTEPTSTDESDVPQSGDTGGVRQTVHYSGRVQGVGFRATAARIAARFEIAGYVQNLPDGRVRLVAEGTRDEVDLYLGSLATAMTAYIRSQQRQETLATGEFRRFFIKRGAI